MTVFESVLLGLVQGVTEFLPVSSSGHLVIAQALLGVRAPEVVFDVAVHVATLLSILFFYRTRVASLAAGVVRRDPEAMRYAGLILVATAPAGLIGVLGQDAIQSLFEDPLTASVALSVTGLVLWSSRTALPRATGTVPGWGAALLIGIAQAAALVPGISRSGSTVVAALWLGVEAREAAAFSFLMAVPAIFGAAVLQIPDVMSGGGPRGTVLAVGSLVAAVAGLLSIKTFVSVLGRRSFYLFAPYCWVVSVTVFVYLAVR